MPKVTMILKHGLFHHQLFLSAFQSLHNCLVVSKSQIQKFWRVLTTGRTIIRKKNRFIFLCTNKWQKYHAHTNRISSDIASQCIAYCLGFTYIILSSPAGTRWIPSDVLASWLYKSCSFHKKVLSISCSIRNNEVHVSLCFSNSLTFRVNSSRLMTN